MRKTKCKSRAILNVALVVTRLRYFNITRYWIELGFVSIELMMHLAALNWASIVRKGKLGSYQHQNILSWYELKALLKEITLYVQIHTSKI